MNQAVQLTYKHTEKEYSEAFRQLYFPLGRRIFYFLFLAFVFSIGIILQITNNDNALSFFFIFISLLFASISVINFVNVPVNVYRDNPFFREECILTISDEGIFSRTKTRETNFKWEACTKVSETTKFYFIWYGKNTFAIIPKTAFKTRRDKEIFQNLFKTHVGSVAEFKEIKTEYEPTYIEPPDWR